LLKAGVFYCRIIFPRNQAQRWPTTLYFSLQREAKSALVVTKGTTKKNFSIHFLELFRQLLDPVNLELLQQ